jgi:hypothetical protein
MPQWADLVTNLEVGAIEVYHTMVLSNGFRTSVKPSASVLKSYLNLKCEEQWQVSWYGAAMEDDTPPPRSHSTSLFSKLSGRTLKMYVC